MVYSEILFRNLKKTMNTVQMNAFLYLSVLHLLKQSSMFIGTQTNHAL